MHLSFVQQAAIAFIQCPNPSSVAHSYHNDGPTIVLSIHRQVTLDGN